MRQPMVMKAVNRPLFISNKQGTKGTETIHNCENVEEQRRTQTDLNAVLRVFSSMKLLDCEGDTEKKRRKKPNKPKKETNQKHL